VQEFLHDLAIGRAHLRGHRAGEKSTRCSRRSPEERRELLEEAAGIAKFRAKKRSARTEARLDPRENLDRLVDILKEIEAQLTTLRRQAQRAEQYKKLEVELAAFAPGLSPRRRLVSPRPTRPNRPPRGSSPGRLRQGGCRAVRGVLKRAREGAPRAGRGRGPPRHTAAGDAHQCELSIEKERQAQGLAADRLLTARARKRSWPAPPKDCSAKSKRPPPAPPRIAAQT
jgi:hypothetical protein